MRLSWVYENRGNKPRMSMKIKDKQSLSHRAPNHTPTACPRVAGRKAADILRRRMDASVLLIKAVGVGWNVAELPKQAEMR
jgi:hypothetical protein